jgi:UDP-glucose 4-epimerase
MRILVAGGSGFFGGILTPKLLEEGYEVLIADVVYKESNADFKFCDLSNLQEARQALANEHFDVIVDLASRIDFAATSQRRLYDENLEIVKNLILLGNEKKIKNFIFTSSNSVFLGNKGELITQKETPQPLDAYGRSKVDSEELLLKEANFPVQIIRCPNIIDAGRVGMLAILFELLKSDAKIWTIGDGSFRHQTIYAQDLISYILVVLRAPQTSVRNIGSKGVPSFREMYSELIANTGSESKIRGIPEWTAIPILKLLYLLKLSPLGPYQFRMLTRSFEFEVLEEEMPAGWWPTKNNTEILEIAYRHYLRNDHQAESSASANSSPVKFGLLRLLKFIK